MAWHIVSSISKLMFTYHGGDEAIENITPPQMTPQNTSRVISDPYPYSGNYFNSARTDGNLALYNAIMALEIGTINLLELATMLNDNETGYLWREEIGRNIRINIKKYYYTPHGNVAIDVTASLYGTLYAGGGVNGNGIEKASLGFVYNDSSEKYTLFVSQVNNYNYSSYQQALNDINCVQGSLSELYKNSTSVVISSLLSGNIPPEPPTPSNDPYADGGYSMGTDTGTGTFDDTSESVPLPTTYALSATASGLMSQYVLTEANLATFGSWLWNGGTIVDDLKHFFQSPMEAIFSVGILPFTPSDTTQYNVYVGALAATGVQGGLVGDTVEKISCGSITFDGYYGGALDYNPYTKIELFLPYCGTLTLNADEVMGHTISVNYYCDTITGDCVAFVADEERVLHQVRGNCFIQIPLAARDFTALYSSAIAAIGTIAAGLATAASGGISAPVAVGMGTSMAANAMNAKTHIARAGGVSGMAGFMSIQTPYVIMTIPNQCLPEFQKEYQGYPLFVTKRLGDFSGFTKVYEIHLEGLDCTDAESKEIYELLKGGVIL